MLRVQYSQSTPQNTGKKIVSKNDCLIFFLNKFTVEHTVASDAFNIMCLTVKIRQDKNINRLLKNSMQKKLC